MKILVTPFKRRHARTATFSSSNPASGHHPPRPHWRHLDTPGHSRVIWVSLFWGHCFSHGSWCTQGSFSTLQESISQSCLSSGSSVVGLIATSSKRSYSISHTFLSWKFLLYTQYKHLYTAATWTLLSCGSTLYLRCLQHSRQYFICSPNTVTQAMCDKNWGKMKSTGNIALTWREHLWVIWKTAQSFTEVVPLVLNLDICRRNPQMEVHVYNGQVPLCYFELISVNISYFIEIISMCLFSH